MTPPIILLLEDAIRLCDALEQRADGTCPECGRRVKPEPAKFVKYGSNLEPQHAPLCELADLRSRAREMILMFRREGVKP